MAKSRERYTASRITRAVIALMAVGFVLSAIYATQSDRLWTRWRERAMKKDLRAVEVAQHDYQMHNGGMYASSVDELMLTVPDFDLPSENISIEIDTAGGNWSARATHEESPSVCTREPPADTSVMEVPERGEITCERNN